MIIKNVELETVCGITSKLPDNQLCEIAFAGKSNVGKSSLINGLVNRKALARTSSQPGKTQTINFYNVNKELYFVDLPGYGYANVSLKVKEQWGKMIERYLHESQVLKAVFLLIDIRHEPSANDVNMYQWTKHNKEIASDGTDDIDDLMTAVFLYCIVFFRESSTGIFIRHLETRPCVLFFS